MPVNGSQTSPNGRAARLLAVGGVFGPVAFVTTWVLAGAATSGYSPVNDAISDLAATHAPARAAMPLGAPVRDVIHGTFASLGYVTLVAVPVLASRTLARAGRPGWVRYSRATGVAAGSCLMASVLGPMHGLFQRVGLTVGDAWLVAVASQLLLARELF